MGAVPAAALQGQTPQPIYAAFSVVKQGRLATRRCETYLITYGTYVGTSTSPDRRLAGRATLVLRIATNRANGTGVTSGTLEIRDPRGNRRVKARVMGVISQRTVNGIVSGSLYSPNALLLANTTLVFDSELGFAAVRLGIESGANSAVAYPPARCD
jgi:hypothetical protein